MQKKSSSQNSKADIRKELIDLSAKGTLPEAVHSETKEPCKVMEKGKYQKLGFWNKRKLRTKGDKAFLVTMLFSNGTKREFVIVGKTETFMLGKRMYYLRYENSWFNLTQQQYELIYFDDCPVPINREIKRLGESSFFSVNPENLKPLIKMEYVKTLAQSQDLENRIKMMVFVTLIALFISIITLIASWSTRSMVKKLIGL